MPLKQFCERVTTNKFFEWSISTIIVINSILIGVELSNHNPTITNIQTIILGIFTLEILMRYIASESNKEFFTGGWNIFDLSLVIIGYIPASLFGGGSMMMAIRILRVFRVLRLLRSAKELKLIISVLIRSLKTIFYNIILFLIFIYLFALIGSILFKLPNPQNLQGEELAKYEQFIEKAPNAPTNSPDPFGTVGESMFTLFRELTGEDWTDVRYNHITAYECGVISTPPMITTLYHVTWFVLSAFLLLNLVVGAIVNNYQETMDSQHREEEIEQ